MLIFCNQIYSAGIDLRRHHRLNIIGLSFNHILIIVYQSGGLHLMLINCRLLQNLQNLQIGQHALLLIILTGVPVKDLGWLNVCQQRDYFTALTVYKSLAGLHRAI